MPLRFFVLMIISTTLFAQGLTTYNTKRKQLVWEIQAIQNRTELPSLFLQPIRQESKSVKRVDLFKKLNLDIHLEPVMALRYSNGGFEIDAANTPSSVWWITPGVNLHGTIPILYNFTSTWIYYWGRFHKHAAYGFDGNSVSSEKHLFSFNPDRWSEYYNSVNESFNGIEFDEGQGGISLLSPKFEIMFGKFQTNLGPFYRDNISISNSTPSFQQIRFHTNFGDRVHFTYLLGSLNSGITNSYLMDSIFTDISGKSRNLYIPRYVALHRLDILLKNHFRLGLYEEIIFGARNIPLEYLNPITPYWSVQHSLGDLDNLIMGIDLTWIGRRTRIIGAFFMDEWNPYKTFNSKDNRNWFGAQLGITYKFDKGIFKNMLIKSEFTVLDPRVYNHRFEINRPEHHGYPLGFWTGGHAQDLWLGWFWFMNEHSSLTIEYESTKIGKTNVMDQYENELTEFLSGNVNNRKSIGLELEYCMQNKITLQVNIKSLITKNLGYNEGNFIESSFSLLYNIPY